MKKPAFVSASLVAVVIGGWLSPAYGDSAKASCELKKGGEVKHGQSGPCTFSQRQGYIDLEMHNGVTYNLSPGDQPNHFTDQNGSKVVRTQAGGGTQVYSWEGDRKLTVTFAGSHSSSADVSGTPADLRDLVNGRRVGGEVDDELINRGWTQAKDEVQGDEVYSYWRNGSRCVVVHFSASRHVSSIANGMESSCR